MKKLIVGSVIAGLAIAYVSMEAHAYPVKVPHHGGTIEVADNKTAINGDYNYIIRLADGMADGVPDSYGDMPMVYDLNHMANIEHIKGFLQAMNGPNTKIKIEIAGFGGFTTVMYDLYQAIKSSPAEITMHVVGNIYSAHAVVAIAGDKIIVEPGVQFMFHMPLYIVEENVLDDYGNPVIDENGDMVLEDKRYYMCRPDATSPYDWMVQDAKSVCKEAGDFYSTQIKHLLTPSQYQQLMNGVDVYIDGQQVQGKFVEFFAEGWQYEPEFEGKSVLVPGIFEVTL